MKMKLHSRFFEIFAMSEVSRRKKKKIKFDIVEALAMQLKLCNLYMHSSNRIMGIFSAKRFSAIFLLCFTCISKLN